MKSEAVKVTLLLFIICDCVCGAVIELDDQRNGTVDKITSQSYTLTISNWTRLPAVRLTATSNASERIPLLVSVLQSDGVTTLRLPNRENSLLFEYGSTTLCPFLSQNTNPGTNITMEISISTSSVTPISYSIYLTEVKDYYLKLDEPVTISVNPNGPASYYFSFDVGVDVRQVLVSVESDPDLCAILLVEEKERNPCPTELTLNPALQGEYQTFLSRGATLQEWNPDRDSSFFVSILVLPDIAGEESLCEIPTNPDLITSFRGFLQGSSKVTNNIIHDQNMNRKNVTLKIKHGLTVQDYIVATTALVEILFVFYLISLLFILRFPKQLCLAIIRGNFCGNLIEHKAEAEEDEDDDIEQTDNVLYQNEELSDEEGFEVEALPDHKIEQGVEETDGPAKTKPPETVEIEMTEIKPPKAAVSATLPANPSKAFFRQRSSSGGKLSSSLRSTQRNRLAYSESHDNQRSIVPKPGKQKKREPTPSVLDILSGRYEDFKVREESKKSLGSNLAEKDKVQSLRRQNDAIAKRGHYKRSSTFSGGMEGDEMQAWKKKRRMLQKGSSLAHDRSRSVSESSAEETSLSYDVTKSLPAHALQRHPQSLLLNEDKSSVTSSVTPTDEVPQKPVRPGTSSQSLLLDPIIEESTLPRPKKPVLQKSIKIDEEEPPTPLQTEENVPVGQVPGDSLENSEALAHSGSSTSTHSGEEPPSDVKSPLIEDKGLISGKKIPRSLRSAPLGSGRREDILREESPTTAEPISLSSASVQRSKSLLDDENFPLSSSPSKSTEAITEPKGTRPIDPLLIGNGQSKTISEEGQLEEVSVPSSPEKKESVSEVPSGTTSVSPLIPQATSPETNSEETKSEASSGIMDDVLGNFLVNPRISDLKFLEGKEAQKHSNRFLWYVIGLSLFYMLPAFQLVIAYQKFLDISGNQDLCYYNHLCSWPVGIIRSFNNIWSNIGYLALGFLLFFAVHRTKYNYSRHEKKWRKLEEEMEEGRSEKRKCKEKRGVPQYFGIYYALCFVMIAQGCTSAAYHICPNQATFQFDTTFMYILAGLATLQAFQSRHPDRTPSASYAFIIFGVIIVISVVGTLYPTLPVYLVWFVIYMAATIFVAVQFYYRGRITTFKTAKIKLYRNFGKPDHIPKFIFVCCLVLINIGIGIAGVAYQGDFGSHLLLVFLCNFAIYMIYYIGAKCYNREKLYPWLFVYFGIAVAFWAPAIYFFVIPNTDWTLSPAKSREGNSKCIVGFYDDHDLWHFLSAFALFFSMLTIMNLDSKQRDCKREDLRVF